MRRIRLSFKFIGPPLIMTLALALGAVILGATAFGQQTSTPEPTSLSTEYTSTPTPEATPTATATPESTSTSTPTATPETTAATTFESTTEQTTPESTSGEPGGFPSITVNPTQGPPGTTVTVTGSGWQDFASRGWSVDIQTGLVVAPGAQDPLPAETTARPNADGTFSVPLTIPESVPPGREVEITAILGNGSGVDASFTVTPAKSVTPGGTGGQDQPLSPNKATKPQGPTPNDPGSSHRYIGGTPPKQGQQDQQKNGLLTGIRRLLNPIFGSGNAHKQGQQDQHKDGLITRIVKILPPIIVPRQGEPPKLFHTFHCTLFPNALSCRGESPEQGGTRGNPNSISKPGDLHVYEGKCFNTSTFIVPTIIKEGFVYLCPSTNRPPQNIDDPVNDLIATDAVIKEGLEDIAGMGQCYNPNSSLYWWYKGHPLIPYSSCTEPLSVRPSKIVLGSDALQRKIESLQQMKPGDVVGPDEVVWAGCTPGYTGAACYPEGKLEPGEVERFRSLADGCALDAAPHIGKSAEVVNSIAEFVQEPTQKHLQEVIISLVPLPTNVVACAQLEEEYVGLLRGSVVPWPSH